MKYPVGTKLVVKEVYSGGNFCVGNVVTVSCIGFDDDLDCYGAISPHDGLMWYLGEGEVAPYTISDYIKGMTNEALAKCLLKHVGTEKRRTPYGGHEHVFYDPNGNVCETKDLALQQWLNWLNQPIDHFDSKIVPKTFSEAINAAHTQYPEASASELETVAEEILEQRTKNS